MCALIHICRFRLRSISSGFDFELVLVGQVGDQDGQPMEFDLPTEYNPEKSTSSARVLLTQVYFVTIVFLTGIFCGWYALFVNPHKRRRRKGLTEKRDVSRWMGLWGCD